MVLLASSGSLDYPFLPSGMELARIYFPLTGNVCDDYFPCTANLLCARQVSQSRMFAEDTDPKECDLVCL